MKPPGSPCGTLPAGPYLSIFTTRAGRYLRRGCGYDARTGNNGSIRCWDIAGDVRHHLLAPVLGALARLLPLVGGLLQDRLGRFVHHRALERGNSLGLVATYRQCSRRPPTKIAEAFFSSPGVHPPLANREPLHCCKSCEVIEAATPPQCGHPVPKRKRPPRD
jgi:hypothetical protein